MQFLTSAALLSLAAAVAADRTFSLTVKTGADADIEALVTYTDERLTVQNGGVAEITLEEPSGYASVGGKYLQNSPQGILLSEKSDASKDWGVNSDNEFRFGPSSDNNVFYMCPDDSGFTLQTFKCEDGSEIALQVSGDYSGSDPSGSSSSSDVSSSTVSSSESPSSDISSVTPSASSVIAPSSYIYNNSTEPTLTTKTYVDHTVVTVTKCPDTVTDCPLNQQETVTTHKEITLTTTYCPASETPNLPEPTTQKTTGTTPNTEKTTEKTTGPAPTTEETTGPAPTTKETTGPAPTTEETTGPAPTTEETTQPTTVAEQSITPSATSPAVTSQYEGGANVARVAGAGIFAAVAAMLI